MEPSSHLPDTSAYLRRQGPVNFDRLIEVKENEIVLIGKTFKKVFCKHLANFLMSEILRKFSQDAVLKASFSHRLTSAVDTPRSGTTETPGSSKISNHSMAFTSTRILVSKRSRINRSS